MVIDQTACVPALVAAGWVVFAHLPVAAQTGSDATEQARQFVAAHEAKVRPLEIAASLAWWNANITGKDEDFKQKEEAQNKHRRGARRPGRLRRAEGAQGSQRQGDRRPDPRPGRSTCST